MKSIKIIWGTVKGNSGKLEGLNQKLILRCNANRHQLYNSDVV